MHSAGYGSVPPLGGPHRRDDRRHDATPPPSPRGDGELARHLSLFDLVCVGVGATVGSGVFVLVGLIAHSIAGPAVSLSWLIAGVAASVSGLCYAELGGRFPSVGSTYVYTRETMGECASVVAGACLTLEYTGSASAVARSWGDKAVEYARTWDDGDGRGDSWFQFALDPGFGINPCAFLVSFASVFLLLSGVKESKNVTNFFSALNVSLVCFMATASLILARRDNMKPFIPPEFGAGGIVRGATSSFFGYIGFDEICCISGEAIHPTRDVPRAILITLLIVTCLYCGASVGLVGMVPYHEISETSGFPDGFRTRGIAWAAEITRLGELAVLPLVVLVTIMAQPRLNFIMAIDGILPAVFAEIEDDGNLKAGTQISGALMIAVATLVPFAYLDDLISSGILVAFTMTDCAVVLVRHASPRDRPRLLERNLAAFLVLSLLTGFLLRLCLAAEGTGDGMRAAALLSCGGTLFAGNRIRTCCPRQDDGVDAGLFLTPCMPCIPLSGCFINLYLIAQLEVTGLATIFGYLALSIVFYFYNLHIK